MQTCETIKTVSEINEPYTVRDECVCVCAACFPGSSIFNLFPDLKGSQLSHGYCRPHANKMLIEYGLKPLTN